MYYAQSPTYPHSLRGAGWVCRGSGRPNRSTRGRCQSPNSLSRGDAPSNASHAGDTAHRFQPYGGAGGARHEDGGQARLDDSALLHGNHLARRGGRVGAGLRYSPREGSHCGKVLYQCQYTVRP